MSQTGHSVAATLADHPRLAGVLFAAVGFLCTAGNAAACGIGSGYPGP